MKKIVPVLIVALSGCVIAAVYLWQELRDVRAQAAELDTRVTELQSTVAAAKAGLPPSTLPASAAAPDAAIASAQPAAPGSQSAPVASPAANASAPRPAQGNREGDGITGLARQMMGTPEGRELVASQLRMILPSQYPDLAKELGLTPAEEAKLFDLLIKQQTSTASIGLDMLAGNAPMDAAAMQQRQREVQELERANRAELTTMLGDRMPKWEEYQRTLPMRQQVNQLRTSLGTGNNALSDSQSRSLMSALAAEQAQIQQDRRNAPRQPQQGPPNPQANIERQLQRMAEDNQRMISVASSHLNPQQLEGYRNLLEAQANMQRTLLRGVGAQLGAQGTGTAQPVIIPATPGPW